MNISERDRKICIDFHLKQQKKRMQACSDEYQQEQERQHRQTVADPDERLIQDLLLEQAEGGL